MPKELRIYGISCNEFDGNPAELTTEAFMDEAETQGNVWTAPIFEEQFNNEEISPFDMFIKFVEVDI